MSDSAYSNYNEFKIAKHESDSLEKIRNEATKGNWDEVSRLFSEMPGLNSPKGFVSSKDLLAIIDVPSFAEKYELNSSLRAIFYALHKWVYPGETVALDMPENKLVRWPRNFNGRGRNEIEEDVENKIVDTPERVPVDIDNPEIHIQH